MSFWVKSRQGSGEYLVDLTSLKGNGVCTCPHFRMRLEPKIRDDKNQRRCKHIMSVREYLADMVILEAIKHNEDRGAA